MKVILHHANKPELICTELLQMIKTGRGTPAETEIRNILCRQNPDFKKKKKNGHSICKITDLFLVGYSL